MHKSIWRSYPSAYSSSGFEGWEAAPAQLTLQMLGRYLALTSFIHSFLPFLRPSSARMLDITVPSGVPTLPLGAPWAVGETDEGNTVGAPRRECRGCEQPAPPTGLSPVPFTTAMRTEPTHPLPVGT